MQQSIQEVISELQGLNEAVGRAYYGATTLIKAMDAAEGCGATIDPVHMRECPVKFMAPLQPAITERLRVKV